MKSPRYYLDEFIVIVLAGLFELSAPIARIQMQSDLQRHETSSQLEAQPPVLQQVIGRRKYGAGAAHIETHRACAQFLVRLVEAQPDLRLLHERPHLAHFLPFAHPIEDAGQYAKY